MRIAQAEVSYLDRADDDHGDAVAHCLRLDCVAARSARVRANATGERLLSDVSPDQLADAVLACISARAATQGDDLDPRATSGLNPKIHTPPGTGA